MALNIDYVSDLHLRFYIKDTNDIKNFIERNIVPKIKSNILVIAGDICEYLDYIESFLYECSKYYDKVLFVAGNHEYYIPNMGPLFVDEIGKEFNNNSFNKIKKLDDMYKIDSKIIFLDRNASNHGVCNIEGYTIAGDTLWYVPKSFLDWTYYYPIQNDSRYIMSDVGSDVIVGLHAESINWYNLLPNDLDLIVTHVPPLKIENNDRGDNCCYYSNVDEYKTKTWIYGHDHKSNEFTKDGTLFLSNQWGYDNKEFKIKTLKLNK